MRLVWSAQLVYGDVFRAPPLARILSVYVGCGFQLFVMTILTLVFAALGFLSPANRGALLSSVLVFFVLMGLPAGYMSARFSKLLKQENQFKTALYTGTLFPGVCFVIFFTVNFIAWYLRSQKSACCRSLLSL